MSFDWIVLVPPLIVILSAAITRHVIASLFAGIISATAIYTISAHVSPFTYLFNAFLQIITNPDKITLFVFLAVLGTVIELMTRSGGVAAYTSFVRRFVTNRRQAEVSSLLISCVFFLDDYLNSLTTGAIMRPLTDAFAVPRAKLAYLINSMSSPLCPLIPLSSWAAMIIGNLQISGISDHGMANTLINADPLMAYLAAIPFMFYAIFIIISAFIVVWGRLSFGAMHRQEVIAQESGNLFGGKNIPSTKRATEPTGGSLADFFVPIICFIASTLFFLLYTGQSHLLGGTNSFVETLRTADTMFSLLSASLFTLVVICIMNTLRHVFSIKKIGLAAIDGVMLMKNSLIVLLLAFTFGYMINNDLQSGAYLANIISASLPLALLPLIIFGLATITTASTGSSWGTIAILMPLTVKTLASLSAGAAPFVITSVPLLLPSLGALVAGSVAGAHFSPITDATVVSAMSAGAYHLDHVKTMMAYALPALLGSCLSFLIIGLTRHWGSLASYSTAFLVGILLMIVLLLVRNTLGDRKHSN